MQGTRDSVISSDGVSIGTLTAGEGRPLLLVHGGMGRLETWEPMWDALADRRQVTAMDRRGRASSGDADTYALTNEYDDIAAVAAHLAQKTGEPVDVFAHSYGATCALGAAARDAEFRRVALYEPPGPQTVPRDWVERAVGMIADGQVGRAMFSFLTEVVGLTAAQVEELRDAPGSRDVLPIVAATLPREANALMNVDLLEDAQAVKCPVLLLLGATSPAWAREITDSLATALPAAELVILPDHGHEAVYAAPDLIVRELSRFFED